MIKIPTHDINPHFSASFINNGYMCMWYVLALLLVTIPSSLIYHGEQHFFLAPIAGDLACATFLLVGTNLPFWVWMAGYGSVAAAPAFELRRTSPIARENERCSLQGCYFVLWIISLKYCHIYAIAVDLYLIYLCIWSKCRFSLCLSNYKTLCRLRCQPAKAFTFHAVVFQCPFSIDLHLLISKAFGGIVDSSKLSSFEALSFLSKIHMCISQCIDANKGKRVGKHKSSSFCFGSPQ